MRMRTILLVLGILLVAGFVLLNLDEFTRRSMLSLGVATVEAPLGVVMLLLLAAALLIFLMVGVYMQSTYLLESRHTARELQTQRELADKAEASRFTELRSYLELQAIESEKRDTANQTVVAERIAQLQHHLQSNIEQSGNTLAAYIGEFEDRLERATASVDGRGHDRVKQPLA